MILSFQNPPVEPMQVDVPVPEDNENAGEEESYQVENPTLDLEAYANSYTGFMRLNRLIYIADHCPSLRNEALKMAITYVMTTYNVNMYQTLHKKLVVGNAPATNALDATAAGAAAARDVEPAAGAEGLPPLLPDVAAPSVGLAHQPAAAPGAAAAAVAVAPVAAVGNAAAAATSAAANELPAFDNVWVETRNKKAALKLEKLDNDLKNYKSNSIKESIRRGHDDLGDHYLAIGDLSNALKCYSRARDYCTSGKHVVNMCLNVIKVSVYLKNWSHVLSYVVKAESTPEFVEANGKEANAVTVTRLKCTAGLAELVTRDYKAAAKHFLLANIDHCDFADLLSPNNVAVYGGLCALATFDRQELQKHVIGNSSFKLFLELEPQVRDIIYKFYESKYAACLRLLDEIRDNLRLDVYIAAHVNALYTQIRNRALIQYFSPYLSADMERMAVAFNRSVAELENEVSGELVIVY